VDEYWKVANEIGAQVVIPVADRYYGLRDFTIADPDGFGVRFASSIASRPDRQSGPGGAPLVTAGLLNKQIAAEALRLGADGQVPAHTS